MTGKLVVISGPSAGVGKDTVLKMFLSKHADWTMPVSTTTRKPRRGEVDGKDMQFVDKTTFEQWQKADKFLESVMVDDGNWYGTLKEPVEKAMSDGKNVVLRKDVRGALIIKQKMPEAVLVFMTAENWEVLEQRIRARGTEDEAAIARRLKLAKQELTYQDKYDFVITNPTGHPEKALAELEQTIIS
jgi:guanylate kinase